MVLFSIFAYTAFGILCIYFIRSGIRKLNEQKNASSLSELYTNEEEHNEAIKQSEEFEKAILNEYVMANKPSNFCQ